MAVELLKVDYRTALSSKPNISTSSNIYMTGDGHLFCENLCVKEIQYELAMKTDYASPFYLYSRAQIVDNVQQYKRSLEKNDVPHLLGYTVSANYNLEILRILQKLGCSAVVASINEIKIAMMAGFNPNMMVYNGNGKQLNELEFAVKCGVMINVDSLFDLEHIRKVCRMLHKKANVLMRLHPEIDSDSSQDITETKFGLHHKEFDKALQINLRTNFAEPNFIIASLSKVIVNIGITSNLPVLKLNLEESLDTMLFWVDKVREMGFDIRYLNMGEGIGLNYKRHIPQSDEILPETKDFISSIAEGIKSKNICLILEPGISIVGNTGILVTKVVGVKTNENKNFIVIDGSMAEVIRPSLYGAYHHIQLIEPTMVGYINQGSHSPNGSARCS
uniref:Probable diaminopimelate decarboxylase, chloroplastic-like n=1 Tax=Saccoglossus kowalevskii TaxID=10224 RepID=A0ABM0M926_SACKO|nr:PREDICTED: probable diaminopimelate decarboxylase, chloroplastic-like [Saccoglossus kowalevskii]